MSKKSKHLRYTEAGEEMNEFNFEKYGKPLHTLYSSSKVMTIHKKMSIINEKDEVIYSSDSKVWTMHDRTFVYNSSKQKICTIRRKFFSLHERHFLDFEDGTSLQVSNEIWHIYKDITNIPELGWKIEGNIFNLNFALLDANSKPIAVVSHKLISIHDKYSIAIYQSEQEEKVVSLLVCLQHMLIDRAAVAASASYSASR